MPEIPRTPIQLPIPEELRGVLTDGWEGTLEVEAEVDSVENGTINLVITGVYPSEQPQDYGPLLEADELEEPPLEEQV